MKYLSGNSQKKFLNITKNFLNISKTPLDISFFCLKNKPIFNHLGQNFQTFLAVVGVKEQDSGASMLPASAILENCCFSAFSDMEYIFRVRNR